MSRRVVTGVWRDRNYRRSFEPNQVEELLNSGKQGDDAEADSQKRVRPCIALNLGKQINLKMLSTVQAAKKLKEAVGSHDFRGWYRFRYLKGDHWKKLRAEKLKSAPVCEICKNNSAEQVHHIRYRSIFDVGLEDLQSVCRSCHCSVHDVAPAAKPQSVNQFREEYEAQERERDERDRKRKLKSKKKGRLEGDASRRYAIYLEKTAPFKFRGNRY